MNRRLLFTVALLAVALPLSAQWTNRYQRIGQGHHVYIEVRAATVGFFRNLPGEAWGRRGIASGYPFTVRALAYMCAGHVTHHVDILRERYRVAK